MDCFSGRMKSDKEKQRLFKGSKERDEAIEQKHNAKLAQISIACCSANCINNHLGLKASSNALINLSNE